MIIHVFDNTYSKSEDLSSTKSGMYPIFVREKAIANIIHNEKGWSIKLEPGYFFEGTSNTEADIVQYRPYIIKTASGDNTINIIITSRYCRDFQVYDIISSFTIGNNPSCDVFCNGTIQFKEAIQLTRVGNNWVAKLNSTNFFSGKTRITNNQVLYFGDNINYFGLEAIIAGQKLIICTPKDIYKINSRSLQPSNTNSITPVLPDEQPQEIDEDCPLYEEKDYFEKAPRFDYIIEKTKVALDEPPRPETREELPLVVTIGPQITMASMSVLSVVNMVINMTSNTSTSTTRRVTIIITIVAMSLTVVGSIVWPSVTRHISKKRAKKREEKRQKKYKEYLKHKKDHLDFICKVQKQTLLSNNPPITECASIINAKNPKLWQRTIEHPDFLSPRIGLGETEAEIDIAHPSEKFSIDDEDGLYLEYKKVALGAEYIENVPITYNLTKRIINAVIGEKQLVNQFLDCVLLQLLTFHSNTDLRIVTFSRDKHFFDYLKVVPHCWNNEKTVRYYANTIDNFNTIAQDLEHIFDARKKNDEEELLEDDGSDNPSQENFKKFRPYYLILTDDISEIKDVPLIKKLIKYKKNLGFTVLISTNSMTSLPAETAEFINITNDKSAIMTAETGKNNKLFKADFNNGQVDMYVFCCNIANVPIRAEKGKYELPKSLPFLEMMNCGNVQQLNSLGRWKDNNPSTSLSVQIGIDQNNEPFVMDIHEKAYGPHGLIAGTTGSGKSEWIITYILALAVNFSPNEVQFVLIDYKGGGLAKSFENKELGIKLPHLAGTITNLDKSEIFRSISAIESELKRRQSIFNEAREKLKEGQMDIYKYQQCFRSGLVDEPLSHLIIICDEFAELKSQQPEFMDQLISTSRIGRSLGVHLILATQKPTGVVNDQIWSNSKFKVALKVQNKGDSMEIIKKPDAAFIKQTGAFYLQVGNDDYFNYGQSAWAGAKYYPSTVVKHKVDVSIQNIDNIGRVIKKYEDGNISLKDEGEQLLNIVSYIDEISKNIEVKAPQMWLENIKPFLLLSDLRKKYDLKIADKFNFETLIGEYDEPRKQKQAPLLINLAGGNIAILSKNDGSNEKLISTIIWSSISEHTPTEIAYYIFDFGAETMKKFAKFPQVGEVTFANETSRIGGVFQLITEELSKRKELLSNYNGSYEYYNKSSNNKLPLMVVVINNYDILSEKYPKLIDPIQEMFRDAPKCGIIFIISSNAPNGISPRLLSLFNHYIVMQIADDSNYRNFTSCRKGLIPKKTLGRGICKTDPTSNDSYCEFQTASIAKEEDEQATIKNFAKASMDYYKCKVKQLAKIPDDISSDNLTSYIEGLDSIPIGVSLHQKDVARYNFLSQKAHIITGIDIKQSVDFLYALTNVLTKVPNTKVRILDFYSLYKMPSLDIQLFDQDPNQVIAALEEDVLTRKENTSCGINIIIGAGSYKRTLNGEAQTRFANLITSLKKSKKSIYIFVDNYESIRTFKSEKWYPEIEPKAGIWLGPNPNMQSLFENVNFATEDLKYNYKGLAYTIEKDDYEIVKLAMDKDI